MSDENRKVLSFGPFELSISNRILTNGTKAVPLGARAMDILIALFATRDLILANRMLEQTHDLIEMIKENV
jgi:DNA-binding winged helix-turn-helix (wHTH) protein